MKHFYKPRVCGLLLTLLLLAGGTQSAFAVGTPSGTSISNQATVNYVVSGVGQAAILSDGPLLGPTTFLVDNRVDLTVVNQDGGTVTVAPGSNNQLIEFLLTNTGNTTQGYRLTVPSGLLNEIPMANVEIWIDHPTLGTQGTYDGSDTVYVAGTNAGDLNPNVVGAESMTVFIVADTPLVGAVDLEVDDYNLLATTLNASTAVLPLVADALTVPTLLNTAGVDVVFADGVGPEDPDQVDPDGTHSAAGSYTVGSATLTVTKTAVVDDNLGNGTTFAIPGATVTYTIVVANTSLITAATTVVITDVIPPETTLVSGSITLDIDGGGAVGQADSTPVTVTIPTLSGGSTATIVFQVDII